MKIRLLTVTLLLCAVPFCAVALGWQMPPGVWTGDLSKGPILRVEIAKDHQLVLEVSNPETRDAVVRVSGVYSMTATKGRDYHVTFTPKSLIKRPLKSPSNGQHKSARKVDEVWVGKVTLARGKPSRLTLAFGCTSGKNWASVCCHQEDASGTPVVVCSELEDKTTHCEDAPVVPGHLINPPPLGEQRK